jgi:hypothetical protein
MRTDGWTDSHDEDDINVLKDVPNCVFWFIGTPAADCQTDSVFAVETVQLAG